MAEPEESDTGQGRMDSDNRANAQSFFELKTDTLSPTPSTIHPPLLTTHYDTIIVGLGPVGLSSAVAAIERGEKVALITDRDPHKDLGVRQQVLGVDEVMDWVSDMIRPDILSKYQASHRLRRTMYQPAEGEPYPYWYFSIGALEEILLDEIDARIADQVNAQLERDPKLDPMDARHRVALDIIKVAKIPAELSNNIDLSTSGPDQNQQEALHQYMALSASERKLTLGNIEEINGQKLSGPHQKQAFYFHDLLAANGSKQQTEKALADRLRGANVHLTQPCYESHVATIFSIRGQTPSTTQGPSLLPQTLTPEWIDDMVEHCKMNKDLTQPVSMQALQAYGWELASRPHQQVYTTGADAENKNDLLYIGCEYPEALKPEALKIAVTLAIKAYNKPSDSLEMKCYQALPDAIRREIELLPYERLSQLNDRDYAQLSSQLARQWSRLLLEDALPKEICCDENICDPNYSKDERAKAILSTSRFDLKFFELGQSLSVLGDREKGWGAFISLGDGRMFPLYTTGTGAQTGLKLARIFHQSKEKFNQELQAIFAHPTNDADYQEKIEALTEKMYSEYHALSRIEIDNIRTIQADWIEKRNQREQKAQQIKALIDDAQVLENKVDQLMMTLKKLTNLCSQNNKQQALFNKPTLSNALQSYLQEQGMNTADQKQLIEALTRHEQSMQTARSKLHHFYTQFTCDSIHAYENIPLKSLGSDCGPEGYCQPLNEICAQLHQSKDCLKNCSKWLETPYPPALDELFLSIGEAQDKLHELMEFEGFKQYLNKTERQGHDLKAVSMA